MKKVTKFNVFLFLAVFLSILFSFNSIVSYANPISNVNIVLDTSGTHGLPNHFRKSTDKISSTKAQNLNLSGLDKLNISGGGQFSETGLSLIKNSIDNKFPITVIDLREESHGFINGLPISWANAKNSANQGLTPEAIFADENSKLNAIPFNEPIILYNSKDTIIPSKVQSELDLTKANSLSYIRIPVTDGHLPSNDMVNYFIDIVKNQPENSWFHFHCKEGIGRTTTFMIMYDIMKNCKEVSLNDIITRQILLSQINEKDANDFYSGRRFEFLSNFYNKCKSNDYNAINQCFNSYGNTFYIKNSIIPKYLYVISQDDMTKEEQTMVATLQGVVATKSEHQIYTLSSTEPDYKIWLQDLKDNYDVNYEIIKDPWILLSKFSSYVNGYILYNDISENPSINNACSLASLKNSIAIDEKLESKVKNHGITNLIYDCRNTDKYWAYDNLWNSGLNHSTVIELSPDKPISLRDYGIISKSLIFYENDLNDYALRKKIFSSMDDGGCCLGWGPDEYNNVSIASQYSIDMIASDWSYNLSALSSFPTNTQVQKTTDNIPAEDDVHYVTFIMSDGDNQQWYLGSNYGSEKWYGSSYRGNFNLGWTISPSIYYLAPTVFNLYYKDATFGNYNDTFLVPPSGNGYIYPSKFPINKLDDYTQKLNAYMKDVDQNYVTVIDDNSFYNKSLWDKYTCHTNIDGIFYLNYHKHNDYNGEIIFSNNKPIVSCRDLLWAGIEDESQLVENINNRIKDGHTNIHTPEAYTFVYVHVWSKTMNDVQNSIDKLNNNSKVRIVTPDTFMKLIEKNLSHE
jgi:hypothetical protein